MPLYSRRHRLNVSRPFAGVGVSIYVALEGQLKYRTARCLKKGVIATEHAVRSLTTRVASASAAVGADVDEVVAVDAAWDDDTVDIDVRPYANGYERIGLGRDTQAVAITSGTPAAVESVSATLVTAETRAGGVVRVVVRPSASPITLLNSATWTMEISGEDDTTGEELNGNGRITFTKTLSTGSYTATIKATANSVTYTVLASVAVVADAVGPTLTGVTGAAE